MRRGVTAAVLSLLTALWFLGEMAVSALQPMLLWPKLDIPAMAALSALSLLAGYLAGEREKIGYLAAWGFAVFGLLPLAAGAWSLQVCLAGGAAFAVCTLLFFAMEGRFSTKAAPWAAALGLWLGSQAFAGIL